MHWILGIILTIVLFVGLSKWNQLDPPARKAATWKVVLGVGVAVLLLLVLTGRVHVLTAAVAGLIPLLRKLPMLLKLLPWVKKVAGQQQNSGGSERQRHQEKNTNNGEMTVAEACQVLGVDRQCSREEVVTAHRRLIQKLHPDRGGNDYLAARVNEAKAVLLRQFS
jgi:choline-glycine betaine transporter